MILHDDAIEAFAYALFKRRGCSWTHAAEQAVYQETKDHFWPLRERYMLSPITEERLQECVARAADDYRWHVISGREPLRQGAR